MTEIDRLDAVAGAGGRGAERHGPGDRGGGGPYPRVHRDGARGPEVRPVACQPATAMDRGPTRLRRRQSAVGRLAQSHIGSQIFDVGGFELAAHGASSVMLRAVVAAFGVDKTAQISTVDLGGGLGISYRAPG